MYNAYLHAKNKEYLYAFLSLISVIPEVGDFIGKSGKLASWVLEKFPKTAHAAKIVMKEIEARSDTMKEVLALMEEHEESIEKILRTAARNKYFSEHAEEIRFAYMAFRKALRVILNFETLDSNQTN